jgi:hypothetical protein
MCEKFIIQMEENFKKHIFEKVLKMDLKNYYPNDQKYLFCMNNQNDWHLRKPMGNIAHDQC